MAIQGAAEALGRGGFRLFKGIFKFKILFIFLIFILINVVIIGIQAGDASVAVNELGRRFLTPTLILQETSLEIIEQQGIHVPSPNIIGGILKTILRFLEILSQFYIILLWIRVFAWIFVRFPLMDKSRTPTAFVFGVLFFFGLQMIFLAFTDKGNMMTPILAFRDFAKAFPYMVKPIATLGDRVMDTRGNVTQNATEIVQNLSNNSI